MRSRSPLAGTAACAAVGRLAAAGAALAAIGAAALGAAPALGAIGAKPVPSWQTNGRVDAIVQVGGVTYLGGSFTQVTDGSGHTLAVSNLAALDAGGTAIAGWRPAANHPVKALAAVGSDVAAGGAFTKIDGHTRLHMALISAAGTALPFAGHANREVDAIAVDGGVVYAGGTFTKASGAGRSRLAAFSASGGRLLPWKPAADGRVDALIADGSQVVAGGFFTHVDGAYAGHLTALDPGTGAAVGWASHAPAAVLALAADGGGVYAGIGGKGGTVAAYAESGGGLRWQAQTDGNVQAIAVAGGLVIPGGHFNNFCDPGTDCAHPVKRHKIAALDPGTGALDPGWHPTINSKLGVFSELGTSAALRIGGDFTKVAGRQRAHYAAFAVS